MTLDFGKSPMVKGRGLSIPISLGARLQAARGIPQAVVKVISYGHGAKGVSQSIDYISREGELELETETGDIILGRSERKELVKNWSRDFGSRKRSRDSVHLTFSMPRGYDPKKLRTAVRKVVTDHFEGHEAVFAIHQDRPHPHAHVVMKTRNRKTGKKLRLGIAEIFQTREAFAEAAKDQGIELAVSPRAARGVGKKANSLAIHHMLKRGVTPRVHDEAVNDALTDWERGLAGQEKPWEKAMRERNNKERKTYHEEAARLTAFVAQNKSAQDQTLREAMRKAAADLDRYSKEMPEPKSRRQTFLEKIEKKFGIQTTQQSHNRDSEMER